MKQNAPLGDDKVILILSLSIFMQVSVDGKKDAGEAWWKPFLALFIFDSRNTQTHKYTKTHESE